MGDDDVLRIGITRDLAEHLSRKKTPKLSPWRATLWAVVLMGFALCGASALKIHGMRKALAENTPKRYDSTPEERDALRVIDGDADNLRAQVSKEEAKLNGRLESLVGYARGRLGLAPTTQLGYDRGLGKWFEVAPVNTSTGGKS